MDKISKINVTCAILMSLFGLSGCAFPNAAEDLDRMVSTSFTNPPRPDKKYVTVKDQSGNMIKIIDPIYYSISGNRYKLVGNYEEPLYYKKENEDINIRYYIKWIPSGLCSYSLLVSPEDVILSWRNEGPKHVSQCKYS